MAKYHLAQVNIGRIKAPLDDPIMTGFVARLDEINALADGSPGFVWRLQTDAGNATYFRPYADDRVLMNMSVWETVEALRHFAYRTAHVEVLRQRQLWFETFRSAYTALWWVPVVTFPASTRRRSAWRISTRTAPRSSRSPSRKPTHRATDFSAPSTGPRFSRVLLSSRTQPCELFNLVP